jgi:hypothetical protein
MVHIRRVGTFLLHSTFHADCTRLGFVMKYALQDRTAKMEIPREQNLLGSDEHVIGIAGVGFRRG